MGTGLPFGTITSLYGLSQHIITKSQFSILITVVILSALTPTLIALRFFKPNVIRLTEQTPGLVATESTFLPRDFFGLV